MASPAHTPGPLVNGQPTTLSLLSPADVATYPHLAEFNTLINAAFNSIPHIARDFDGPVVRVATGAQIVAEIGPDFFTLVLSANEAGDAGESNAHPRPTNRLLASGSGRRVLPRKKGGGGGGGGDGDDKADEVRSRIYNVKHRLAAEDPGVPCWELKLLVVHPSVQKQGLASLLVRLVEAEIVKRSRSSVSEAAAAAADVDADVDVDVDVDGAPVPGKVPRQVRVLLDTFEEHSGRFYEGRGYTVRDRFKLPVGYYGSKISFTSIAMDKYVDVV